MKPDMKIGVLFDVVDGHDEESDFIALRQVFASRLVDYFIKHPEVFVCPYISFLIHFLLPEF